MSGAKTGLVQRVDLPIYNIKIVVCNGAGTLTSDLGEGFDGIESLILAMACAGIDLHTAAMLEAIETAVEAAGAHS